MASSASCLPPTTVSLPPTLPSTKVSRTLPELHGNMASATDQLALTKTSRAPTVSTSTRQAVPAFLNKLYNMVSNPETDELVRWSEEGDSFYIPSHERLSKELLPRFFKHGNFSSFVRQLNMYGFHKVPHLQQGVLQNSTETELWQFQNPHFQRGQPDLLCLITRKKTGGNADGGTADDAQHSSHAISPSSSTNQAAGPLDMTVLTSSLAAIKKHQTSLSAELKTLQESNQHLWNEALAARDRHKKHQDTINKILKFLASVFGNGASAAAASGPGDTSPASRDGRASPGALVPRKRPRLMIENGTADDEDFVHFAHASPDASMQDDQEMFEGRISETADVAQSLAVHPDPPVPSKTEPPPTPTLRSVSTTPPATTAPSQQSAGAPQAVSTTNGDTLMNTVARRPPTNGTSSTHDSISPAPPGNPPQPFLSQSDEHAQEQLYQETMSKLLSSPTALQRILASLSTQGPDNHNPSVFPDSQSELAPYYGGLMNMAMDAPHDPALAYNATRLDQATDALGADVENVQQDINTLMREWGISPDMLHDHPTDADTGAGTSLNDVNGFAEPPVNGFAPQNRAFIPHGGFTNGSVLPPNSSIPYASIAPQADHVDIDSFLNQFEFSDDPSTSARATSEPGTSSAGSTFPVPLPAEFDLENPGAQPAAFLDEVHPIPSAASDTSLSPAIPLLDDFGTGTGVGGAGLGRSSSPAARFTTPAATVSVPPLNGAPTAASPTPAPNKRGRKRRSVALDAPSAEEPSSTSSGRTTRHK